MIGIAEPAPPQPQEKLPEALPQHSAGTPPRRRAGGLLMPALALSPPLLAFAVQLALWSLISPYVWFLFFPAVFVSSWIGGLKGGVLATVLSAGLVWWFFVTPVHVLLKPGPKALFPLVTFLVMGAVFGQFHDRLRLANWRAVQALASANTANRTLEVAKDEVTQLLEQEPRGRRDQDPVLRQRQS